MFSIPIGYLNKYIVYDIKTCSDIKTSEHLRKVSYTLCIFF